MGWGKCLGIELRWQVHGLGQVFGNRIEVASTWVGGQVFGNRIEVASTWVGGKCLGIELRWQVHGLGASVWE